MLTLHKQHSIPWVKRKLVWMPIIALLFLLDHLVGPWAWVLLLVDVPIMLARYTNALARYDVCCLPCLLYRCIQRIAAACVLYFIKTDLGWCCSRSYCREPTTAERMFTPWRYWTRRIWHVIRLWSNDQI